MKAKLRGFLMVLLLGLVVILAFAVMLSLPIIVWHDTHSIEEVNKAWGLVGVTLCLFTFMCFLMRKELISEIKDDFG